MEILSEHIGRNFGNFHQALSPIIGGPIICVLHFATVIVIKTPSSIDLDKHRNRIRESVINERPYDSSKTLGSTLTWAMEILARWQES